MTLTLYDYGSILELDQAIPQALANRIKDAWVEDIWPGPPAPLIILGKEVTVIDKRTRQETLRKIELPPKEFK